MKNINVQDQKLILSKAYITMEDIYKLLPIGKNYAAEIFHNIENELSEKGIPRFQTRPRVIPTDYLIKAFPELRKVRK